MKESKSEENVLKEKAKKILEEKRDIIQKFMEDRILGIEESLPNNKNGTYTDKPIIYIINPKENKYNLYIKIFNFPALLRKENGLFTLVHKIIIIFKYFSDKMKTISKDEYERNFSIFFKSILNCDFNKFNELIGTNIQKNELNILKQGLESIQRLFGIEVIKNYFSCSFGLGAITSLIGFGGIYLISNLLSLSLIGLGAGIAIGIIFYFSLTKINDIKKGKIWNNKNILEKFFSEIKDFEYNKFKCCNIFVIAIDKNGNQINDICLFPDIMGNLNSYGFPTIGGDDNGETNIKYYENLIKGIEYYTEYYKMKLKSQNLSSFNNDMLKDLKKDIDILISSDEEKVKKLINEKINLVLKIKYPQINYNSCYQSQNSYNFSKNINTDSMENFFPSINTNETVGLQSERSKIKNEEKLLDLCP